MAIGFNNQINTNISESSPILTKLNSNQFIIHTYVQGSSWNKLYIGTLSGNNITIGSGVLVDTYNNQPPYYSDYCSVLVVNDNTFYTLLCYQYDTYFYNYRCSSISKFNVAGNTITRLNTTLVTNYAYDKEIGGGSLFYTYPRMVLKGIDIFLSYEATYDDGDGNSNFYSTYTHIYNTTSSSFSTETSGWSGYRQGALYVTLSDETQTVSGLQNNIHIKNIIGNTGFLSLGTSDYVMKIIALDTNRFIVVYMNFPTWYARLYQGVNGATITPLSGAIAVGSGNHVSVTKISDTQLLLSTTALSKIINISNNNLSLGQSYSNPYNSVGVDISTELLTINSFVQSYYINPNIYIEIGNITADGKKINGITYTKWNGIAVSKYNGI